MLGGKCVCATAVTRRAFVCSMGVPFALMHAPDVVNANILHCRCERMRLTRAKDALGMQARVWARMRSSARLTSVRARAQPTNVCFFQRIELTEAFPFWGTRG